MISLAKIRGMEVVELIDVDEDPRLRPRGTIGYPAAEPGVAVGWVWDGSTFHPSQADAALAAERAGMRLTKRQFVIAIGPGIKDTALAGKDWITEAEGDAWLKGDSLPLIATNYIASLPANQQAPARFTLYGMSVVYRTDPLLLALAVDPAAQLLGVNDAEIDNVFRIFANV